MRSCYWFTDLWAVDGLWPFRCGAGIGSQRAEGGKRSKRLRQAFVHYCFGLEEFPGSKRAYESSESLVVLLILTATPSSLQPFYPVGASACNPGLYFHVVKDLQVIISSPPFSGSSAAQVRFSGSMVLSVCQMSFSATKRIIWIVEVSEQRKTCTCCWKGCFTTITTIIFIIIIILLLLLRFLIAIFIRIYYSQYIHCWCHSFWSFLFSLWSLDHNYVKA